MVLAYIICFSFAFMLFHQFLLNSVSSSQDLTELAAFAYLRQHQNIPPRNSPPLITSPILSTGIVSITIKQPITTIIKYIIITICSNCYSLSYHRCQHHLSNRHRIGHQEGWVANTTVIVLPDLETCHSTQFDLHLHIGQNNYHLRPLRR